MGALANAAALRRDEEFRSWVETAIAYQARVVIGEAASVASHNVRLAMARDAAVSATQFLDVFVTGVATDPAAAAKGGTAALVTEQTVLDLVAGLWTPIAQLRYPGVVG